MEAAVTPVLVRAVRRWDAVALMINCIVGAGIFGLPSRVYELTGTWSLFAFVACALIVAGIAFCYVEVASRFTETGGPYLYARVAFGPFVGFQVGWLAWLARVSSFAFILNVLVSYLSHFWPSAASGFWRVTAMTGLVSLLTIVNVRGVRNAAILSDILSVGKMIPLLIFIAVGIFFINPSSYTFETMPAVGSFSLAVSQLFVSFTGFELALIAAGEARDPKRNLPFALVTALAIVVVIYLLIQVVCIGTLPDLAKSAKPLADASLIFMGSRGSALITLGAVISATGTLSAILLGGSRLPFAMAEQEHLPRVLATTHERFRTPWVSIVLTAGAGLGLALSGTFVYAITIAAISKLLTSMATCAALPTLRRRDSLNPPTYLIPGGTVLAVIGFAFCTWLLVHSGWSELRDVAVAAAIGLLCYFLTRLRKAAREKG
jgi:basic amino acid/polyamine antiporter, APA family